MNKDSKEIIIDKMNKEIVRKQDAVVLNRIKELGYTDIAMESITRAIHKPAGHEVWSYKGKPFLKIEPFEYSQIILPNGDIQITASQKVKMINVS